jgi:hypothetical protein
MVQDLGNDAFQLLRHVAEMTNISFSCYLPFDRKMATHFFITLWRDSKEWKGDTE